MTPEEMSSLLGIDGGIAPTGDPLTDALMARLLSGAGSSDADDDTVGTIDGGSGAGELAEAEATIDALALQIREMQTMLSDVAAALGACPSCLGDRRLCDTCGGRGRPGSQPADRDAFDWYVRPIVARARRHPASQRPLRPAGGPPPSANTNLPLRGAPS